MACASSPRLSQTPPSSAAMRRILRPLALLWHALGLWTLVLEVLIEGMQGIAILKPQHALSTRYTHKMKLKVVIDSHLKLNSVCTLKAEDYYHKLLSTEALCM